MPRKFYVRLTASLLSFIALKPLSGQSAPAPRDPEGLRLIQKAETALVGNRQINDGVLQGNLTSHFDIMKNGSPIFTADVKFTFWGGAHSRTEAHYGGFGMPSGSEICTLDNRGEIIGVFDSRSEGEPRSATARALGHGLYTNCWSAPIWFFPAMLLKSAIENPRCAVLYHASRDGSPYELVRLYEVSAGNNLRLWQNLTVREVQLDRRTLLPVSIKFWRGVQRQIVPEDPLSSTNHPIEVQYSDYRSIGGVWVPFRIDWSQFDGSFEISITLSAARFNTGIDEEDFSVPGRIEPEPQDR